MTEESAASNDFRTEQYPELEARNNHSSEDNEVQEKLETKFKVLHACTDSQMPKRKKDYISESQCASSKKPAATAIPPDEYLNNTVSTEKVGDIDGLAGKSPLTPAVLQSQASSQRRRAAFQLGTVVHLTDLVRDQQMTRRRIQKRQIMSSMTQMESPASVQSNTVECREEPDESRQVSYKGYKRKSGNTSSLNNKIGDEKRAIASKPNKTLEEKHNKNEWFKISMACRDISLQNKQKDKLSIYRPAPRRDGYSKQMKEWLETFDHIPDIGLYDTTTVTYDSFENRLRQNCAMNEGVVTYSITGPKSKNKVHFLVVKEAPGAPFDSKEPPDEHPSITLAPAITATVPIVDLETQLYENIAQLGPNTVKNTLRLRQRLKKKF